MARFLQLSDLHAVPPGTKASGVLDTNALLHKGIDRLLARRDALGPLDAVLVTGDISDDGSAKSYAIARAELDRFGLPLLVLPGNHDRRDSLRAAFSDTLGMPKHGLIDWTVEIGDTMVVGLDTLIDGQGGGELRPESLAHLTRSIEGIGDRHLLIALHHPPMTTGIRFMDRIALKNPNDLAQALAAAPVHTQIIAGHVHGIHVAQIAGHAVMTAPAMCSAFEFDVSPGATVGFHLSPRGCAVVTTGQDQLWSAISLEHADGPFSF